jgi:antirestriction protein
MTNFTALLAEYRTLIADDVDQDTIRAYYLLHSGYLNASHFQDSYEGTYDSERDANEHLVDSWYEGNEIPERFSSYIDEAHVLRDMLFDYNIQELNNEYHLFRSC